MYIQQEYFKKQSSEHPIKFRYLNDTIETLVLMLIETVLNVVQKGSLPLSATEISKCFSEIHYSYFICRSGIKTSILQRKSLVDLSSNFKPFRSISISVFRTCNINQLQQQHHAIIIFKDTQATDFPDRSGKSQPSQN